MTGGGAVMGSGTVPKPTGEGGDDGVTWADGIGVGVVAGVGSGLGSRVDDEEPSVEREVGFSSRVLSAGGRDGVADGLGSGLAWVTVG